MNNVMFDIRDLSQYLNVSISLIRKLIRGKKIPYNRIGTKLLFSKNEIDKWLIKNQNDIE